MLRWWVASTFLFRDNYYYWSCCQPAKSASSVSQSPSDSIVLYSGILVNPAIPVPLRSQAADYSSSRRGPRRPHGNMGGFLWGAATVGFS